MARKSPPRTRTWGETHLSGEPGVAVFVAETTMKYPAEDDSPAGEMTLWQTLVWWWTGSDWKLAHQDLQPGGLSAEREGWNDTFRSSAAVFNHKPNKLLVDAVATVKPGTALDLAMGQGRNGVYLATRGWKVTGVDISDVGLKVAREAADAAHVPLQTIEADLETWDLGKDTWDLVTLIYAGDDAKMLERIKAAVSPGGLVVIEYFHDDATKGTGLGGFKTGQLAKAFAGWAIVRDEALEDLADWGLRPTKLARFIAKKP
jgi:SAM-dependent methyltransferase